MSTELLIRDFSNEAVKAQYSSISPAYLEMLRIALVQGRGLEEGDTENAPLVAVINESMARKYFPGGAVGKTMEESSGPPRPATAAPSPIEIVGVVRDSKYDNLREEETMPMLYVPIHQKPMQMRSLQIKTRAPLSSVTASVRQALLEVNRDIMIRLLIAWVSTSLQGTSRLRCSSITKRWLESRSSSPIPAFQSGSRYSNKAGSRNPLMRKSALPWMV